jgi:hypothetical protein
MATTPISPRQWNMVGAEREAWARSRARGSTPATERRYSEAFKRGIYTVDERVPQLCMVSGDRADPLHPPTKLGGFLEPYTGFEC